MNLDAAVSTERERRTVVRLRTCTHIHEGTLRHTKELRILRRKSRNSWFEEDIANVGADLAVGCITNLYDVKDGVYTVETCNEHRDWESGLVEEYDYVLVPFKEKTRAETGTAQDKMPDGLYDSLRPDDHNSA